MATDDDYAEERFGGNVAVALGVAKRDLSHTRAMLEKALAEVEKLRQRLASAPPPPLADTTRELANLQSEIAALRQALREVEAARDEHAALAASFAQREREMALTNGDLQAAVVGMERQLAGVSNQRDLALARVSEVEAAAASVQRDLLDMQAQWAQRDATSLEIEVLGGQVAADHEQWQALQGDRDELLAQVAAQTAKVASLDAALQQAERRRAKAEADAAAAVAAGQAARSAPLADAERLAQVHDAQLRRAYALQAQVTEAQTALAQRDAAAAQAHAREVDLQAALAAGRDELTLLQAQLRDAQALVADARVQATTAQADLSAERAAPPASPVRPLGWRLAGLAAVVAAVLGLWALAQRPRASAEKPNGVPEAHERKPPAPEGAAPTQQASPPTQVGEVAADRASARKARPVAPGDSAPQPGLAARLAVDAPIAVQPRVQPPAGLQDAPPLRLRERSLNAIDLPLQLPPRGPRNLP